MRPHRMSHYHYMDDGGVRCVRLQLQRILRYTQVLSHTVESSRYVNVH